MANNKNITLDQLQSSLTRVKSELDKKSDTDHTHGVVSTTEDGLAPKRDGSTTKYLRADGTWQVPPDTNTDTKNTAGSTDSSSKLFLIGATSQAANPQTYSHDTAYVGTDGCLYSGGSKVLTSETSLSTGSATGTATLSHSGTFTAITGISVSGHKITPTTTTYTLPADNNTTYNVFNTTTDGLVPKSGSNTGKFLKGDGTWATPTNTTYSNMTGASSSAAGKAGLVPAPAAGNQTQFLRGDGTWATPTDTNTTYTFATGDSNGQIKVTPSGGTASNISIKGLGSAAYTASSDYAPASHVNTTHLTIGTTSSTAAAGNHTHNYAGSSSAGGAATSANKVNSSLSIQLNGGTATTFDGSAAKSINITPSAIGAAASHSHPYLSTSGGTITGNITTNTSGARYIADNGTNKVWFGINTDGTKWGMYDATSSKYIIDGSSSGYTFKGNADTATKLATARTIRTKLGSTSTASFDGSENITPGVTGTLAVGNGGTGQTSRRIKLSFTKGTSGISTDVFAALAFYYPYLDMVFFRGYFQLTSSLSASNTRVCCTLNETYSQYFPVYQYALACEGKKKFTVYINTGGEIHVMAQEAMGSGDGIWVTGFWFVSTSE